MIQKSDIDVLRSVGQDTLFYVGSPYSASTREKERERFGQVCAACSELISSGLLCFSPIAHSHPIAYAIRAAEMPTDFSFWSRFDRSMLRRCDAMIVLHLPGWTESKGLQDEIAYAVQIGRKTFHVEPEL